jgi:hypothetical protein
VMEQACRAEVGFELTIERVIAEPEAMQEDCITYERSQRTWRIYKERLKAEG